MRQLQLKRLLVLLFLASSIAISGCAGSLYTGTPAPAAVQISAKSLMQIGDILKAAPDTADKLFTAGKIDKSQYNQLVLVYNKVLQAYGAAVTAETTALKAGLSPNSSPAYQQSIAALEPLVIQLQALLTGGK